MKTETCYPADTISRSITTATHANLIADTILSLFDRIAAARRARAVERGKARERMRTARIVAELPREIRADIGWQARYDDESLG